MQPSSITETQVDAFFKGQGDDPFKAQGGSKEKKRKIKRGFERMARL